MAGELHVVPLIHLHFCQAERALILVDDPLQMGREGVARCAPVGPEVHEDRLLLGRNDDLRMKTQLVYVEDSGVGMASSKHREYHEVLK